MKKLYPLILLLIPTLAFNSNAQVLERRSSNSGTSQIFSYSISSSYGVNTSANATPNLIVNTEAVLNLQKDSYLTNKAGNIGGSTGAVFTASPNGSNVQLTGITADNKFLIDDGTSFKTSIESGTPDGNMQVGNASSTATHTMTLLVTLSNTAFATTIRENFEGLQ